MTLGDGRHAYLEKFPGNPVPRETLNYSYQSATSRQASVPPLPPHPLCCFKSKPVDLNLDECESFLLLLLSFSLIHPILERFF